MKRSGSLGNAAGSTVAEYALHGPDAAPYLCSPMGPDRIPTSLRATRKTARPVWRGALFALVALSVLAGCTANRELRRSLGGQTHVADPDFQVRYLGTGCFIMNYKGSKLLTDPFISNPRALRSIAGTISTDSAYVTKHLRPDELSNVRLVASGMLTTTI